MDSITQAALGAAIGQTILGEKMRWKAPLLGAVIATVPDLDVLLYAFYSPLDMLSIHRGFSHSIVFSLIASFILAFLLSRMGWTHSLRLGRIWLLTWSVLITHLILDVCTAYGTQLLLPFSDSRIGLDCINVVDPVYTLPLLFGLGWSIIKNIRLPNMIGLVISSLYLLAAFGLKHTVINDKVNRELNESISDHTEFHTIPVGIGSIHWYAIAKSSDSLYLRKFSLVEELDEDFVAFPINEHLLDDVDAVLVERMKWFSKGLYTVVERDSSLWFFNLQVDMRGFVHDGVQLAPTAGFFELREQDDGTWQLSSGTVMPE